MVPVVLFLNIPDWWLSWNNGSIIPGGGFSLQGLNCPVQIVRNPGTPEICGIPKWFTTPVYHLTWPPSRTEEFQQWKSALHDVSPWKPRTVCKNPELPVWLDLQSADSRALSNKVLKIRVSKTLRDCHVLYQPICQHTLTNDDQCEPYSPILTDINQYSPYKCISISSISQYSPIFTKIHQCWPFIEGIEMWPSFSSASQMFTERPPLATVHGSAKGKNTALLCELKHSEIFRDIDRGSYRFW